MKIWIIGIIILAFYLLQPVPYCQIIEEKVGDDVIYTTEEKQESFENVDIALLEVTGTSMLPTIQDNSQCLCIKKCSYNVGDIVFFSVRINNEWIGITHRIFSIDGDEIVTKGDNNEFLDSKMKKENIGCAIPMVARYNTLF